MDQSKNANQGQEIVEEKEENTRTAGASRCLLFLAVEVVANLILCSLYSKESHPQNNVVKI